jgi:hypothetical protein
MSTDLASKDEILILTGEPETRGFGSARKLKVEELSVQVNLFLDQMGGILERTPPTLGRFQFVEFEIKAEITSKGSLALLGTGGELGATGGIKFVFRRPAEATPASGSR